MIGLASLPALNAVLNATSAVFLATGFVAIRRRRVRLHRACMVVAFIASILFLVSYLTYHLQVGTTRFPGQGWVRPFYFVLLGTHTVLAATIPPLAITTLAFALGARFRRHARLARWTLPLWFYVSVTGVLIYVMLYVLYPAAAASRSPAVSAADRPARTNSVALRRGPPDAGATTASRTRSDG